MFGPAETRAINRAAKVARHVWNGDYRARLAAELARALPCAATCVYELDADGRPGPVGQTMTGEPADSWEGIRNVRNLPSLRRYALRSPDPYENVAVPDQELYREDPEAFRTYVHTILEPHGLHHQLRVALYRGGRFLANVAAVRTREDGPFDARATAMLQAMTPALLDGLTARSVLGDEPLEQDGMARVLDAFEEPAYLCNDDGVAVFANAAARGLADSRPEWLPRCVQGARGADRLAKVTYVNGADGAGRGLHLVVPRAPGKLPAQRRAWDLPPRLAEVADLVAQGLTDREIARSLGVSYQTARTYVTRTYERLGAASRVEVARMAQQLPP